MAKPKTEVVRLPTHLLEELRRWRNLRRAQSIGDVIGVLMEAGDGGALDYRNQRDEARDFGARVLLEAGKGRAPAVLAMRADGDGDAARALQLSPRQAWERLDAEGRMVAITQAMPLGDYPPEVVGKAYVLGGVMTAEELKQQPRRAQRYRMVAADIKEVP